MAYRFLLFFAVIAVVIQFGQSFDSHESTENTDESIEDSHETQDPRSHSHESVELISSESKSCEKQDHFSEPQRTTKQDVDTKLSDVPIDGLVETSETPGVAYGGNGSHGPEDYHLGGPDHDSTHFVQLEAGVPDGHTPHLNVETSETPGVAYGGNGSHGSEDYHLGGPVHGDDSNKTKGQQVEASHPPASRHGAAPTVIMEDEEVLQEHTQDLNNETAGANYEGNEAGGAGSYHLREDVPVPTTDNNVVAALTADTTETPHVPYDDDDENHHGDYHLAAESTEIALNGREDNGAQSTSFVEKDNSVPFIPAASPSRLATPKDMDPDILI
uniref:uncharacterized protein isoform X6 n=1 Tax=Myxine glutinosa TaxID=7769 RepID=UPI00358F66BF